MKLQEIVSALARETPDVVGVVLCDFEGESVVSAEGSATLSADACARAREHVPSAMALNTPVQDFLLRLAAAEPCGPLRLFGQEGVKAGAGHLRTLELRHETLDVYVAALPEDYYLFLVTHRSAFREKLRVALEAAGRRIAPELL